MRPDSFAQLRFERNRICLTWLRLDRLEKGELIARAAKLASSLLTLSRKSTSDDQKASFGSVTVS